MTMTCAICEREETLTRIISSRADGTIISETNANSIARQFGRWSTRQRFRNDSLTSGLQVVRGFVPRRRALFQRYQNRDCARAGSKTAQRFTDDCTARGDFVLHLHGVTGVPARRQ